MQEWRDIKGFNGYKAYRSGIIKKDGKIVNQYSDQRRYLQVSLKGDDKKYHTKKVHHVIWDTFGSGKRNGHKKQIDHIDGNSYNNNIENLQLVTAAQNSIKRSKNNKVSKYPNVSPVWNGTWSVDIMRDRTRHRMTGFRTELQAFLYRQKFLIKLGEF